MSFSAKDAALLLLTEYKGFELMSGFEMPDKYVFAIKPSGSSYDQIDCMYSVDKKTRKVSGYTPLLNLKEYNKYYSNTVDVKSFFLSHSGVKGMQWGIRQWQYLDGSLTPEGYVHYGYGKGSYRKQLSDNIGNDLPDLTKNISTITNGYAGWATLIADDLTEEMSSIYYNDPDGKEHHIAVPAAKRFSGGYGYTPFDESHRNLDVDKLSDREKDNRAWYLSSNINNGGFGQLGTTNNCTKCAAACELQRRGYTNLYAGRSVKGNAAECFSEWFKGATHEESSMRNLGSMIRSKYGANTSGELNVWWPNNGGGHAVHWSCLSDGDTIVINDGQTENTQKLEDWASEHTFNSDRDAWVYRLDDKEINWDAIARDSVIRVSEDVYSSHASYNRNNGVTVDHNSGTMYWNDNYENAVTNKRNNDEDEMMNRFSRDQLADWRTWDRPLKFSWRFYGTRI